MDKVNFIADKTFDAIEELLRRKSAISIVKPRSITNATAGQQDHGWLQVTSGSVVDSFHPAKLGVYDSVSGWTYADERQWVHDPNYGTLTTDQWVQGLCVASNDDGEQLWIVTNPSSSTGGGGSSSTGATVVHLQEEGVTVYSGDTIDIRGAAITANASGQVVLSQSPTLSTGVVGTGRLIQTSAPLQGGGSLTGDLTLSLLLSSGLASGGNGGLVVNLGPGFTFTTGSNPSITPLLSGGLTTSGNYIVPRLGPGFLVTTGTTPTIVPNLGGGLIVTTGNTPTIVPNLGPGLIATTGATPQIVPNLGAGLIVSTGAVPQIFPNLGPGFLIGGDGTQIYPNLGSGGLILSGNVIQVNPGTGLQLTSGGTLIPNLGSGMTTSGGQIIPNVGSGGLIVSSGVISVNPGAGISISNGKVQLSQGSNASAADWRSDFFGMMPSTSISPQACMEVGFDGSISPTTVNGTAQHPGIVSFVTQVASSYSSFHNQSSAIILGSGTVTFDCIFQSPSAISVTGAAGLDNYMLKMGLVTMNALSWSSTGEVGDGTYIIYNNTINSGKFQARCVKSGTATTGDMGVALSGATWYHANITIDSAGSSATFLLDAGTPLTLSSNMPTGAMGFGAGILRIGANTGVVQRNLLVDYASVHIDLTLAR